MIDEAARSSARGRPVVSSGNRQSGDFFSASFQVAQCIYPRSCSHQCPFLGGRARRCTQRSMNGVGPRCGALWARRCSPARAICLRVLWRPRRCNLVGALSPSSLDVPAVHGHFARNSGALCSIGGMRFYRRCGPSSCLPGRARAGRTCGTPFRGTGGRACMARFRARVFGGRQSGCRDGRVAVFGR